MHGPHLARGAGGWHNGSMRKRYPAELRQRLISEVRSTGEGVAAVAKRLGVTPSSAYLWLKGSETPSSPVFARVVPSTSPVRYSLTIEVGAATIRVQAGFDAELLRSVVVALSDGK
jgi:transposase-like protein